MQQLYGCLRWLLHRKSVFESSIHKGTPRLLCEESVDFTVLISSTTHWINQQSLNKTRRLTYLSSESIQFHSRYICFVKWLQIVYQWTRSLQKLRSRTLDPQKVSYTHYGNQFIWKTVTGCWKFLLHPAKWKWSLMTG